MFFLNYAQIIADKLWKKEKCSATTTLTLHFAIFKIILISHFEFDILRTVFLLLLLTAQYIFHHGKYST